MSGLAKMALNQGDKVSGSDLTINHEIELLQNMGVSITVPHSADCISQDIDLIVYTAAISSSNVELEKGRALGIQLMERAEFLGLIANEYKNVISIAGTHGKTTTTSMIAEILTCAGFNPTVHLGGESKALGGNTIIGGRDYFVVEACEYKESFRYLKPTLGIITNVELDHVDYYNSYDDIKQAFERFAGKCNILISRREDGIEHNNGVVIGEDWVLKHVEFVYHGYNFNLFYKGRLFGEFRLNMLGIHNVYNAVNAIICCHMLGVGEDTISQAISSLEGVARRYECIHKFPTGCRVIIDYAHHPTELATSMSGLQGVYGRILYIFQPHTYTRTKALFEDFIDVLEPLKNLVIFKTYPARENYVEGGDGKDLWKVLKDKTNCLYYDNIDKLTEFITQNQQEYDCVLILGAGDLAEKLKRTHLNA